MVFISLKPQYWLLANSLCLCAMVSLLAPGAAADSDALSIGSDPNPRIEGGLGEIMRGDRSRYVRTRRWIENEDGSYGLLIEFGARQKPIRGARIRMIVGNYGEVREWFGPPRAKRPPSAEESALYTESFKRNIPPFFFRRFRSPSIRPDRSYYLYFESFDRIALRSIDFANFAP